MGHLVDDLDSIKSNPGVARIYAQYVKGLKKTGDKFVGLCPVHGEKTPSFTVFSDMRFHCFGCGIAGNIFQLLEKVDNCDFKTAVEKVKKELGGWFEAKDKVESTFAPVAEPKVYEKIPLSKWQKQEDALTNSDAGLKWLSSERGIGPGTAQRLHLGFIQNIGPWAGQDGADIADKGWIGFPSVEGDEVVSIKFRSLERKKPGGFARRPKMATALFNAEAVSPFDAVYLVEGEIDCLTLEQAGFRSVSVPSAGTKLTPEMKDTLMQAECVILAGDMDPTGSSYMEKLLKELGERTYLLKWPEPFKDSNEFFLNGCTRDVSIFRTKVEELTTKAKSNLPPDIYSIQEVMKNGEDTSLADRPDRLRFPWKAVDEGAILLPGSVLGVMSTSTGQGKTAFTLQLSLFGARSHNETVVNWQCELSPSEISVMVASQVLRKNRNFLTKADLNTAADQLEGVQYFVGNNPTVSNIGDVLDIMEAAIRRTGATVAVLDNVHFYTSGVDDDVRVLASSLKRIKQIAVTYGVKFIVVFQPRKASQQTRGKKTQISDVKGSASAGDTCDAVAAIHRDISKSEGDEAKSDTYEERTLVEWLKTRSKGIGKASSFLHFFGEFASFNALDTTHEENPLD
jgi:hypothetical protein